jgi:DNA-binding MarR family transcriptional regulator
MSQIIPPKPKGNISGAVDAELAAHADEIRRLYKRTIGDIVEIGRRLIAAKPLAGHGNWLPWLKREFGWKEQSARNFMNVAELAAKSPTVVDLNINFRGLYLLAAPATPVEVVEDVAALGRKITVKDVTQATSARKRASVSPAPPKSKSDSPNIDPYDVVVAAIRAKCSDNKWWLMPKIATTVQYAEDACRQAMKRLEKEGYVARRKTDKGIEYQIREQGEVKLRRALAAQGEEIARLKARIVDLEKLLELATAPTAMAN